MAITGALSPQSWHLEGSSAWFGPWIGLQLVGSTWGWDDGTTCTFDRWDVGAGQPDWNQNAPDGETVAFLYNFGPEPVARAHDVTTLRATRSLLIEWSADCNNDGIVDYGQILAGQLPDANSNGVPDSCETIRVPADFPTIQAAVNAAFNGFTILVAPGSYAPFNFNGKRITVQSTNGAAATTIDASGQNVSAVVFGIGASFDTTLRGFTIKTGNAGGGGGVLLNGDGTPTGNCDGTIEDCRFIRGTGTVGYGGGLYAEYGNVVVRRCVFDGLYAQHFHGAMGIAMTAYTSVPGLPGVSVLVEDCEIRNCNSYNSGGVGVRGIQSSKALFRRVHFTGNSSPFSTGALITGTHDTAVVLQLDVDRCVFAGNSGPYSSGISEGLPLPGTFAPMVFNITGSIFADAGTSIVTRGSTQLRIQGTRFCSGTGAIASPYTDLGGNSFSCAAPTDCDFDGLSDAFAIVLGRVADIDGNGIPDTCENLRLVPQDYPTIQSAINSIAAGTRGTVFVAPGTYPGPIDFLGKDVIVRGTDVANTVIQGSSGQVSSVVRFSGNEPATAALERVTIRGGLTGSPIPQAPQFLVGGGLFANESAARVRDCVFENNFASFGGGAYLRNSSTTFERCTFRMNGAGAFGGGLQFLNSSASMSDCLIEQNSCESRGGGIHVFNGTTVLTRVAVYDNLSTSIMGGISFDHALDPLASLQLVDCDVDGNRALVAQGGIGLLAPAGVTRMSLSDTTVCANLPRPNISGTWQDLGGNTVCICIGDLTGNDFVNGDDLGILLGSWGPCVSSACDADLNGDEVVDGNDLGLLLAGWGQCPK